MASSNTWQRWKKKEQSGIAIRICGRLTSSQPLLGVTQIEALTFTLLPADCRTLPCEYTTPDSG